MFDEYLGLGDYLSYFEAAPQTQPSQSGLIVFPVNTAQGLLNRLGAKLVADGKFGPKTAAAWGQAATTRKLNPTFQRVDAASARVDPKTAGALSAAASNKPAPKPTAARPAAKPAPKPAAARPAAKPAPAGDLVSRSVLELQGVLHSIGWTAKKVARDGLFGKQTSGAWAHSAKSRGLPQTFERVDGKTARVSNETLKRFIADGKTAPAVKSAPAASPSGAGSNVYSVIDLQTLLYGIGWTAKKLAKDGKFGPQTQKAWGISAQTRKLPTAFVRVDGTHARVDPNTYAKIAADAKAQAPIPVQKAPGDTSKPVPSSGTIDQPVLALQDVLYGIGWTSKKLTRDGKFGPQTQKAWATSATSRKLPTTFVRVDGKTARVDLATLNRFLADAKKAPAAPSAPAPTSGPKVVIGDALVNISVDGAQKLLYGIGWTTKKLKNDGAYGAQTKNAWATSAKTRKLPITFDRIDGKTARVDSRTLAAFAEDAKKAAADKAPPAPPEPSSSSSPVASSDPKKLEQKAVAEASKVGVKAANAPIKVLAVQQALAATGKFSIKLDGKWSSAVADALMILYQIQSASQAVWKASWPKLVSKDKKTVKLLPNWVAELTALAAVYKQRANAAAAASASPASSPETLQPVSAPEPQPIGTQIPGPGGQPVINVSVQGPGPSGGYSPPGTYSTEGPTQEQSTALAPIEQPAPDDGGAWLRLVGTLRSLGEKAPKITEALEAAAQRGPLAPETVQAYAEWVSSAKNILATAQTLLSSPQLKQAIDATGGAPASAASTELSMYFADLSAASDEILAVISEPFPVISIDGSPLAGFGQAAQVAGAAAVAAGRFLSVAWARLIQLISTPTVARIGTVTVVANGAKDVLNSEMDRYAEREERLDNLVAEGKLTVEDRERLKGQSPGGGGSDVIIPVAIGAVALGGFWIWLKSRKAGGSHAKSR